LVELLSSRRGERFEGEMRIRKQFDHNFGKFSRIQGRHVDRRPKQAFDIPDPRLNRGPRANLVRADGHYGP